jgi:trans-2,3-dihydro-3-hydroxyanthranilate isomerase
MNQVKVYQIDSFTNDAFGGNPAGVVTDADNLSETEMQKIAREMNCSETAFIMSPTNPMSDFKIRFFTPSEEVDLCGHATIAAFYALASEGKINLPNKANVLYQETKAGVLPITLIRSDNGELDSVVMGQTPPRLMSTCDNIETVANLIGLETSDLNLNNLPLQIVSTGLPDMIVPVKDLSTLKKASPDFSRLAEYQRQKGFISIHAFTFETEDPSSTVHVRDFAPSVNINEEAATGTANGALGAYLVGNKAIQITEEKVFIRVEQGYVMNRPSKILVEILHYNGEVTEVAVGGSAIIIMEGILKWQ